MLQEVHSGGFSGHFAVRGLYCAGGTGGIECILISTSFVRY